MSTVTFAGWQLTLAGAGRLPELVPTADQDHAFEMRDDGNVRRGRLSQAPGSRCEIEIFVGASGLSVIVTDPGVARYLCFPGSSASVEGCEVELAPDAYPSSLDGPHPLTAGSEVRQSVTTQAALMAGGLATRFAPISGPHTGHSKPGVPIAPGASLIRTIVSRLVEAGITDVFINTHYAAERLIDGLADAGARLHFLHEAKPSGTAGPIRKALQGTAYAALDVRRPLLIVQGDALIDVRLSRLLEAHGRLGDPMLSVAVQAVLAHDVEKYGIVATDCTRDDRQAERIVHFMEKPTLEQAGAHRLASTGIYVLGSRTYSAVLEAYERKRTARGGPHPSASDVDLDFARDVFPIVLERAKREEAGDLASNVSLQAVRLPGYWNDIGNPTQYFRGIQDVRAGRVRLPGTPIPDVDATGVVYWGVGRACAKRARALLRGNVLVVPDTSFSTSATTTSRPPKE